MGKDIFTMEKEEILISTYELTLLISPDLSEFDVQKVTDKVKNMVTSRNGQIVQEHTWGKKRLAYPIKKADFGYYQTIIFSAPKETINEIAHDILLVPEILRYLSLSLEKEGVTIDQLFTPEKEVALVASMMKEKIEPTKTRSSRRIPRTVKLSAPTTETINTSTEEPIIPTQETEDVLIHETDIEKSDDKDRLKALDEKLDQIFKEE